MLVKLSCWPIFSTTLGELNRSETFDSPNVLPTPTATEERLYPRGSIL